MISLRIFTGCLYFDEPVSTTRKNTLSRRKVMLEMNINCNSVLLPFWGYFLKCRNRPFARSSHTVRNKLHWDAQVTQWDFQNKGTRTSPARFSFVSKVPLRNLRPSVIFSVPCDRIVQRAHSRVLTLTGLYHSPAGIYTRNSHAFLSVTQFPAL